MTLLEMQEKINNAGVPLWHYEAAQSEYPYAVYQEYSTTYNSASGNVYRETTAVSITHFSKTEFDPSLEKLKTVLLANNIIPSIATTFDKDSKNILNQFEFILTRDIQREGTA